MAALGLWRGGPVGRARRRGKAGRDRKVRVPQEFTRNGHLLKKRKVRGLFAEELGPSLPA
jgi:hypothetical protein